MKERTCLTCAHHTQVQITGFYDDEGDPIPITEHYCDGEPLNNTARYFRCGKHKEANE